ncbi:MAG: hypothetical protein GYA02_09970 [Clostridiaceae bacterium]|nr:hypothetical protein [Clostridiaceae bacterium]
MINIKKLRLFPFATKNVAYTQSDEGKNYNIIFYPENASFSSAYSKLKIRRIFARFGTVLPAMFPRLILNPKTLFPIVSNGLRPVRVDRPFVKNMFIDTSLYLDMLDKKFEKKSYRRPIVYNKILAYLLSAKEYFKDRENILMYYVDLNKPIPDQNIFMKRSYLLFSLFRSDQPIPFDYVMLAICQDNEVKYSVLKTPTDQISSGRIFAILKQLKYIPVENSAEQQEVEEKEASDRITTIVHNDTIESDVIEPDEKVSLAPSPKEIAKKEKEEKEKTALTVAVKQYISKLPDKKKETIIHASEIEPEQAKRMTIKAAVYGMTKDIKKAERISKSIKPEKLNSAVKTIKREVAPTILKKDTYKNEARDPVYKKVNINRVNENKNPSAVLNKRHVDFDESFESDLKKSFNILSRKDKFPLKVSSFTKKSIPVEAGDLEPTKMVRYSIKLKEKDGTQHDVDIEIPEIQPDGTFLINGNRKYLVYQSIVDPIFFFKPGEASLQTMYAPIATHWKKTKHKSYFQSQIGGYWLPTSLLLSYYMGFSEMCKLFSMGYRIEDFRPNDNPHYIELTDGKFLVFYWQGNRLENRVLINSLKEITGKINSNTLVNKNNFKDLIIKQTENRNSIFKIDSILENIMEPIAVEVLKTKLQPTTLEGCILYICQGLVAGRVDDRNDITKQRIRSAEIFNYQIQKQILRSYNVYLSQKEHGDENATFYCDTRQLVQNIVNDKLVQTVENINPYEELSGFTKVSPVGPGGVADKHAITKPARNLHDSYYGNYDPMDTPENDSVGVINQLTVDSAIGNVRGSFGTFEKSDSANSSILSTSASIVPYVNSCDGCRVMLGASQTRQTIPIMGNEPPIVQTGFETILTSNLSRSYIRKSPVDGIIAKITENSIYVKDSSNKIYNIPMNSEILKSAQGKSSLNYFSPVVSVNDRVKAGQILAEGKHIKNGIISVGRNLLTAIMGWKGYGFEDGYIISETVANRHFVSTAYEEIVVYLNSTSMVKMIANEGADTKKGEPLIIRSSRDVEELLDIEEDELVDGQYVKASPGGKIIAIEIYPNISLKKFPILIPQFEKFRSRYIEMHGSFPAKFLINDAGSKKPFTGVRIVFKIERYDSCNLGDKITNNHGGKGVLTLIEKDENMPITPWGERIQLMLNPIAIVNRMNPSTLFELYSGLIGKFLARQMVSFGLKKSPRALQLLQKVYTTLDNTPTKKLSMDIINAFKALDDKQYAQYIREMQSRDFLPIYVPPFQSPNIKMINEALKLVGAKDKYTLKLPEYNTTTKNPVTVGWLYYKKLEQQSDYKISSRSISKYSESTGQPVAGAKHGGGRRLGEMDSYALASHGAETLLKELMGPLSDDAATKNEIIFDIIQNGEAEFREPKAGKTKDLLNIYMAGMMLDVKL